MTRVLITNDDGIAAPGIRRLAHAAIEHGLDVVVAAPLQEASGSSAAMSAYTADGRVIIEPHRLEGLPQVTGYAVGASPSYIVVLAMLATFGEPPDLVLSGINLGANAGRAVMHSGTVGAALTAAAHNTPAMAVSLAVPWDGGVTPTVGIGDGRPARTDEDRNWATAARLTGDLLGLFDGGPERMVLNVNVPDVPADEVRGLRQATLAEFGQVQMALAERGEDFVRTSMEQSRNRAEPGTDLALLSEGYATITAIQPVSEIGELRLPVPGNGRHARPA